MHPDQTHVSNINEGEIAFRNLLELHLKACAISSVSYKYMAR